MTVMDHIAYSLLWFAFGIGHSLLSGAGAKRAFAAWLGPAYRLAFNIFASLHFAITWYLGLVWLGGGQSAPLLFPAWVDMARLLIAGAGFVVVLLALRTYDLGRFSGLTQLRHPESAEETPEAEPLLIQGPHRLVRHPLYSGVFLFIWGIVDTEFSLATAVWVSLYLVIGSRFEERRLARLYGRAYETYRADVPAFVPTFRALLNHSFRNH